MDMEDVDKLLEEAAEMAERKTEEERTKREGTAASSRPGSRRSDDSRRRSRSPRRDRDRDRDGYRRRDDRDRDHYRPGGRRPSVSDEDQFYRPGRRDDRARGSDERSRAYDRPRDRERDRDHDRDRDRRDRRDRDRDRDRERDRDRGHGRDRGSEGRSRDHGRRTKTPELNDDERDSRTVFVQQLAARLRTKELSAFFETCGTVKEAQIVKDRVSGRSKGVGYVEFKDEESVEKALQLTGQKLLGIPVIVQMTEAEKNRQARTTDSAPNPQNSGVPFHRLYVGNIHFSITEEDLRNVFEPFGELEFVQLQKEEQGRSKGYGFVQYRDPDAAKEALEKMNGFDLANRPIRVGLGNDRFTNESTQNLLQRFPQQQNAGVFGAGGRGTHAGGDVSYESKGRRDDRGGIGNASALNDTDVGESNLANISRHEIMQKLLRRDEGGATSNGATEKVKPVKVAPPKPQAPQVTRCVVLTNVYDLAEEEQSGGNWKDDLLADIKTECDRKFGRVVHIDTDPNTTEVFIKFSSVEGAGNAVQGLNGRHFGGRQIAASPLIEAVYNAQWRQAIDL